MESNPLNDIILTGELCTRLYNEGIVNLETKSKPEKVSIHFEGGNQQQVLVAVDLPGEIRKDEKELLINLLKACQLTVEDVALINTKEQEASVEDIIKELTIKKAIFFGVPSLVINLPIGNSENSVIIYDNKYFLKTSPLSVLKNSVPLKRALWEGLKNMFNV